MKGFVRGHEKIGECSLKQYLAMDHMPKLKAIELEAVYPGPNLRDRRYRKHPAIKTLVDATSLEPTVDSFLANYYVRRMNVQILRGLVLARQSSLAGQ